MPGHAHHVSVQQSRLGSTSLTVPMLPQGQGHRVAHIQHCIVDHPRGLAGRVLVTRAVHDGLQADCVVPIVTSSACQDFSSLGRDVMGTVSAGFLATTGSGHFDHVLRRHTRLCPNPVTTLGHATRNMWPITLVNVTCDTTRREQLPRPTFLKQIKRALCNVDSGHLDKVGVRAFDLTHCLCPNSPCLGTRRSIGRHLGSLCFGGPCASHAMILRIGRFNGTLARAVRRSVISTVAARFSGHIWRH